MNSSPIERMHKWKEDKRGLHPLSLYIFPDQFCYAATGNTSIILHDVGTKWLQSLLLATALRRCQQRTRLLIETRRFSLVIFTTELTSSSNCSRFAFPAHGSWSTWTHHLYQIIDLHTEAQKYIQKWCKPIVSHSRLVFLLLLFIQGSLVDISGWYPQMCRHHQRHFSKQEVKLWVLPSFCTL